MPTLILRDVVKVCACEVYRRAKAKFLGWDSCQWLGGLLIECWLITKGNPLQLQSPVGGGTGRNLGACNVSAGLVVSLRLKIQLPFSSWMLEQCYGFSAENIFHFAWF